jgi:pilus assembly protein CpaD
MSPTPSRIATRRGGRIARLAAIAGFAAVLAGCNTIQTTQDAVVTGSVPADYRQRHAIVVKEGPRTVELFIGDKRGTLTGPQRAEVVSFANEWRREATGGILVDVPSGASNATAAVQAAQEVRSILGAAGVPPQAVQMRENRPNGSGRLATLRLHYPRVTADAGPCGLWPHDLGPTWEREHYENREYWNLGCAAQRNLAAMVENPADLVQPRGEGPTYTGRRTTVLDKYHRGESSATTYPDADKGKISSLGK